VEGSARSRREGRTGGRSGRGGRTEDRGQRMEEGRGKSEKGGGRACSNFYRFLHPVLRNYIGVKYSDSEIVFEQTGEFHLIEDIDADWSKWGKSGILFPEFVPICPSP
jgi:hypothetical protein